jgi:hypothetical protein
MKQLANVLKCSFASLFFLTALAYSDSNIQGSQSDNVLIDTENSISQDLMNLFSNYLSGKSEIQQRETKPSPSLQAQNSTKPVSKKRRRGFLKSLISSCGKVLVFVTKLAINNEAVNLLIQIPKLAEKLLKKLDEKSKNINSIDIDDLDFDINMALFRGQALNFIKSHGLKDIPSSLDYLPVLNSPKSDKDSRAISRRITNQSNEICLYEVFLILFAFLKNEYNLRFD